MHWLSFWLQEMQGISFYILCFSDAIIIRASWRRSRNFITWFLIHLSFSSFFSVQRCRGRNSYYFWGSVTLCFSLSFLMVIGCLHKKDMESATTLVMCIHSFAQAILETGVILLCYMNIDLDIDDNWRLFFFSFSRLQSYGSPLVRGIRAHAVILGEELLCYRIFIPH